MSDLHIASASSDLAGHPAVLAWQKYNGMSFRPRACEELRYRKSGGAVFRLSGQDSSLIAKRCTPRAGENERFVYQEILPQLPFSFLCCYGTIPDDDPEFCWLFLEDAGDEEYSSEIDHHRVLAGRWLGAIHIGAQQFVNGASLDRRAPGDYRDLLELVVGTIAEHLSHPALSPDERKICSATVAGLDLLKRRWDRIEDLCIGMPTTLVHDDLAEKNARIRSDHGVDNLLIMDWESASWGAPAADLAQFLGGVLTPDLATYTSVVQTCWPLTLADVRLFAEVGTCFRLLSGLAWASWGFQQEQKPRRLYMRQWYVGQLRWHEGHLSKWLRQHGLQD
jgi:hypothetical protein